MQPLLTIQDLSAGYGGKTVIRDISMRLVSFNSGKMHNAIPRDGKIVFAVKNADIKVLFLFTLFTIYFQTVTNKVKKSLIKRLTYSQLQPLY